MKKCENHPKSSIFTLSGGQEALIGKADDRHDPGYTPGVRTGRQRIPAVRRVLYTVATRWFGGTVGGRLPPNPRRAVVPSTLPQRGCPQPRVGRRKCAPSAGGCPPNPCPGVPFNGRFRYPQTIVSPNHRVATVTRPMDIGVAKRHGAPGAPAGVRGSF
jgi:hypothetical protein